VLESGADFSKALEHANSLSVSIAKELTNRAKAASNSSDIAPKTTCYSCSLRKSDANNTKSRITSTIMRTFAK
jgi:hypothetical protein